MRVIGVIDLRKGRAVHARGGRRDDYQPVRPAGSVRIKTGDAAALADAYRQQFGLSELYVADLDAIAGESVQDAVIGGLARRMHTLVDAAVTTSSRARHVLSLGAHAVVVGLETLTSFAALDEISRDVGGERVVFSLDLRNGSAVGPHLRSSADQSPENLADSAVAAGAQTVLVLDLARVGTDAGLDHALISRVRRVVPAVALLAGGGIRHVEDLKRLADVGCDGALVASALHSGHLTPGTLRSIQNQESGTR